MDNLGLPLALPPTIALLSGCGGVKTSLLCSCLAVPCSFYSPVKRVPHTELLIYRAISKKRAKGVLLSGELGLNLQLGIEIQEAGL